MGGEVCPNTNAIEGQVVVVTGGEGGIGKMVCQDLCNRKGHVIIAGRDVEKMKKIRDLILQNNPRANIETRYLDLRSFDCVRRFVRDLERDHPTIDCLINNAGIIFAPYAKTADGFETHLQVNYLSHFLLVTCMIGAGMLKLHSRVINVSCHAYLSAKMTIDDPLNIGNWAPAYHARDAFAHSKACIVMATRIFANLLKQRGVTVNSCTPGLVRGTGHLSRSPIMGALCAKVITLPWMWLFMKTSLQGAQCIIHMATDPKFKYDSGGFYNDCQRVDVSELAKDDDFCRKLFKETVKALKLDNDKLLAIN